MITNNVTIPNIKWAQRKDKLFITIDVVDIANPKIDIENGRVLKFHGTTKDHTYGFELEFYEEVSKEDSKYTLDSRNIFLNIQKQTKGPYWPRLTKESVKLNWLHPDWKLYIDEDEEEEEAKPPQFGNEMSKSMFNF
jgi:prostaglandin-E synthase